MFSKKNKDNHKKFLESEEMNNLNKYLKQLTEKFEKTKFNDEKIKEEFEEKIKKAINFSQRISNAEKFAKDTIERINNQKLEIDLNDNLKEEKMNKTPKKQKKIKTVFEEEKIFDEKINKNKLSKNNSLLSISDYEESLEEKKSN